MEKYLGRKLDDNECVHHMDNNKRNNKIWNLELMLRREHLRLHVKISPWNGRNRRKIGPDGTAWCGKCRAFKPKEDFPKNRRNWSGVDRECMSCKRQRRAA